MQKIEKTAKNEVSGAKNLDELNDLRIKFLGRERGALTLVLRNLKNLPQEERKIIGKNANHLKILTEELFEKRGEELKKTEFDSILKKEWLDVTRPGAKIERGSLHPITLVRCEVEKIFSSMGFGVVEGPEVETEWYNFDALNIPKDHPARDLWDTFWLKPAQTGADGTRKVAENFLRNSASSLRSSALLLRTHTSPVQIRYMQSHNPPIRIIAPGRVYRYEATDAGHDIQFHHVEGLMIDKHISIANFKAVILELFKKLFGKEVKIRLRPSYFPFVEPGFEVDLSCIVCNAKGCPVCKKTGWSEIMGAGMVHPKVFEAVGYIPRNQQGFAFGIGLDRITMMKYKIPDIRLFHSGDLRFLKQF
ncbi:MAG: Phenylalanine-tRNA ligase alpha subunit [Parcubacteria group bacterium GW2011_GWA2_42_14]|nr:MAG: Phenylalanine-tRNA ligase alpha subunit [Parcubacteria group bacterium GW2011_GWA2_42_14]